MKEACKNMFGSIGHLVEVVDYKHIRCLACKPYMDVKAYSAYHTACIRKHFIRHHDVSGLSCNIVSGREGART
jgi:hypothetical protein